MWLVVAAGLLTVEVHDTRRVGGDRIQVELGATAITIDGQVMDAGGEWTVLVGGEPLPLVERRSWAAGEGELVIAVVIRDVPELARLADSARAPLARLSSLPRSTVTTSTAGPALLDAVAAAVDQLDAAMAQRGQAPRRCVVIVVADGLDADPRAARYTELGTRANSAGVRIHTLAWHPTGDRRPMLGLAELSARSHGTFRMVTGNGAALAGSLDAHITQLLVELGEQPQLIVEAPPAVLGANNLSVRYGAGAAAIESRNRLTLVFATPPPERGLRWWWIAGPGVLLAGGAAAFVMVRRRKAAA